MVPGQVPVQYNGGVASSLLKVPVLVPGSIPVPYQVPVPGTRYIPVPFKKARALYITVYNSRFQWRLKV